MKINHSLKIFIYISFFALSIGALTAQVPQNTPNPPTQQSLSDNPNANLWPIHDPVMVKQDNVYYLFGSRTSVSSSTDLVNWKTEKPILDKAPEWMSTDIVPGWNGGARYSAPDVQLVRGTYYVYYDITAFAKNTSAIGVATNKTLHPSDPDFKWVDRGMVVQSVPNRDMWNALDPMLMMDGRQGWLVFGSFWGGIKMVKLAPDLLTIAKPEVWYTLARQPRAFALDDTDPGDGTIEGPFIYKRGGYFYLFVSLDYCCRGIDSDYNVVVGRSKKVTGPYVDKEGKLMSNGGGTLVAKGNTKYWAGVGHSSHYDMDGKSLMLMHGYDKMDNGASKLIIREMKWTKGWPSIDL